MREENSPHLVFITVLVFIVTKLQLFAIINFFMETWKNNKVSVTGRQNTLNRHWCPTIYHDTQHPEQSEPFWFTRRQSAHLSIHVAWLKDTNWRVDIKVHSNTCWHVVSYLRILNMESKAIVASQKLTKTLNVAPTHIIESAHSQWFGFLMRESRTQLDKSNRYWPAHPSSQSLSSSSKSFRSSGLMMAGRCSLSPGLRMGWEVGRGGARTKRFSLFTSPLQGGKNTN